MKNPTGAVCRTSADEAIRYLEKPGSECWRSIGKTIARAAPNTTRLGSLGNKEVT